MNRIAHEHNQSIPRNRKLVSLSSRIDRCRVFLVANLARYERLDNKPCPYGSFCYAVFDRWHQNICYMLPEGIACSKEEVFRLQHEITYEEFFGISSGPSPADISAIIVGMAIVALIVLRFWKPQIQNQESTSISQVKVGFWFGRIKNKEDALEIAKTAGGVILGFSVFGLLVMAAIGGWSFCTFYYTHEEFYADTATTAIISFVSFVPLAISGCIVRRKQSRIAASVCCLLAIMSIVSILTGQTMIKSIAPSAAMLWVSARALIATIKLKN